MVSLNVCGLNKKCGFLPSFCQPETFFLLVKPEIIIIKKELHQIPTKTHNKLTQALVSDSFKHIFTGLTRQEVCFLLRTVCCVSPQKNPFPATIASLKLQRRPASAPRFKRLRYAYAINKSINPPGNWSHVFTT